MNWIAFTCLPLLGVSVWVEPAVPILGEIIFRNDAATAVTNLCTGVAVAPGAGFLAELYSAPDGVTNESLFARATTYRSGPRPVQFTSPGHFNGGSRWVLVSNSFFVMWQVRVWESAFGSTYEEAVTNRSYGRRAYTGRSKIFRGIASTYSHPLTLSESGLEPFTVGDPDCLRPGSVLFESSPNTVVTNLCTGEAIFSGSNFLAGLYYANDGFTNEVNFTLLGATVPFGPEAGQFHGGLRFPFPTTPGEHALFQVRVWEAAFGATYDDALAAPPRDGRRASAGKSAVLRMATSLGGLSSPATALTSNGLDAIIIGWPGCVTPGSVLLQNNPTALVTNLCTAEPVEPGATFLAALYYAPDGQTNANLFIQLGNASSFGPEPGRFHGGLRFPPNVAPGGFAMFQTRVWESAFGASYEEAVGAPPRNGRRALTGKSTIARVRTTPEGLPLTAPAEASNSADPFYIGAPDCNLAGSILFQTSVVTPIINACTGRSLESGSNFLASLYYAPAGVSNEAVFVQLGEPVGIGPQPGRIQGGPRIVPGTTTPGQNGMFQVRVWEAAFGATYEEAIRAQKPDGRVASSGKSLIVSAPTQPSGSILGSSPALSDGRLASFTVGYPLYDVAFENTPSTLVYNICLAWPLPVGVEFLAALYYAPAGVTNEAQFIPLSEGVAFGPSPGQVQGGPRTIPQPVLAGDAVNFQVRAWESFFGSTYEQARSAPAYYGRTALTGTSPIFRVTNPGQCAGAPSPSLKAAGLAAFHVGGQTCMDVRARFITTPLELPPIRFAILATGRINDDEWDDAVTLDGVQPGVLHIMLSRGDGTFEFDPFGSVLVGAVSALDLGDFNGDAKADLILAIAGTPEAHVRPGDGQGGFGVAITNAMPFAVNDFAVGDFNGDGKIDAVVADNAASSVALFVGDGTGRVTSLSAPLLFQTTTIASGDFDGDCLLDLVALHADNLHVVVLINDGQGGFADAGTQALHRAARDVSAADFNGDGQTDLAIVATGTSSVTVHLGQAATEFTPIAIHVGLGLGCCHGYDGITVGDFNGDGKSDILMGDNAIYGGWTGAHSYYHTFLNQTDWPQLKNDNALTYEDTAIAIDVLANDDRAGVPLTVRAISAPAHGSVAAMGSSLVYVPATNFFGTDSFVYSIYGCTGVTNLATVTIQVLPVNDAPVAVAGVFSPTALFTNGPSVAIIAPGSAEAVLVFDGSMSFDADHDPLQFRWTEEESGTVVALGALATNTLAIGTYHFVLNVSDGTAAAAAAVTVEVITAGQAVRWLSDRVEESRALEKWTPLLLAQLRAAYTAFDKGNFGTAIQHLHIFKKKAEQIGASDLATKQLIAAVQRIIDAAR